MAGSPNRRAQRAAQDATRALTEGREDDARRALAELKRCLDETGVEVPSLPPDVMTLWVSISEAKPARLAKLDGTALMSDAARQRLLQAGEIASMRLLEMLADDRMFGYAGVLNYDQQMGWLNLALQRGYGGMPAGAQKVPIPKDMAPGQMAIGNTLQLLVRARQEQQGETIEGEINGSETEWQ